ncbi:MAG: hypothetical protein EBU88_01530 [Acidobacteria bacterium]|nr:hypothetical protein [Acidobacteriota bacterium]
MNAVVMAGGSGTRFWPASREWLPKQFLSITSNRSMLEETIARIAPTVPEGRISVIVGRSHESVTKELLGSSPVEVLLEPVGRNTAACIGLAALHWRRRDPATPLVVLPADHFIARTDRFNEIIVEAGHLAQEGAIVTLGVEPTRPETGYGYIEIESEVGGPEVVGILAPKDTRGVLHGGRSGLRAKRFVEKPDFERAERYLASGNYLWNSGIFVFTPETIIDEIGHQLPDLARGLEAIDQAIGRPEYDEVLNGVYRELPSISIDHGIMERTTRQVYVMRSEIGWSDVGSWQALYDLRSGGADSDGNLLLGKAWIEDSRGNLVYSTTGRTIALLGVEGLAVVDTGDALMVADLGLSQEVKRFAQLEKLAE